MFANIASGCGRISLRHNLAAESHNGLRTLRRNASTGNKAKVDIKIPPRIERGPLDVLKALSATIEYEPQVALFNNSNINTFKESQSSFGRRKLELSYDSGKKAARWVVDTHPELFSHELAEPYIKAFAPKRKYLRSEPSEESLLVAIQDVRVKHAIAIYKKLKESGVGVSDSTKQQLLELVCFYNGEDEPSEALSITKFYEYDNASHLKTWKSGEFAEELFESMEPTGDSYSALICGLFRYNDLKSGYARYEEATEKGLKLTVDARNCILKNLEYKKLPYEEREKFIQDALSKMAEDGVRPNLGTLNSVLHGIMRMRKWMHSRRTALRAFGEFVGIGVEPSLATYYYLLGIVFDESKSSPLFEEILSAVEARARWELRDPLDTQFFVKAMTICDVNYKSFALARRVDAILNAGTNRDFLVSNVDICFYYRSYFSALCASEDLDTIMENYFRLTPWPYAPELKVVVRLLNAVGEYSGFQHLPRLWKSIVEYRLHEFTKVQEEASSLLLKIPRRREEQQHEEAVSRIARDLFAFLQERTRTGQKDRWTPELASNLLLAFLRLKSTPEVYVIFQKLKEGGLRTIPKDDVFPSFIEFCVEEKLKSLAMEWLEYSKAVAHDASELAERVEANFDLTEAEKRFVAGFMKEKKRGGVKQTPTEEL